MANWYIGLPTENTFYQSRFFSFCSYESLVTFPALFYFTLKLLPSIIARKTSIRNQSRCASTMITTVINPDQHLLQINIHHQDAAVHCMSQWWYMRKFIWLVLWHHDNFILMSWTHIHFYHRHGYVHAVMNLVYNNQHHGCGITELNSHLHLH